MLTSASISINDIYRAVYHPFAAEMTAERKRFQKIRAANAQLLVLKNANLVAEKQTAEGLVYALTKKGLEALIRERIIREEKKLNKLYCMVIFDIPESQRSARDDFRNFLRRAGFFQIQKSAWATDKDVADVLLDFVTIAKIERWVNIFIADPLVINLNNKGA